MGDRPERASVTPEDFRKIREIFESALERPILEREAFVEKACGGDGFLIQEVRRMLAAEIQTDALLDRADPMLAATGTGECPSCQAKVALSHQFCPFCGTPTEPVRRADGRFRTGALFANRYRIVGLLGRGGMGEVYRAQDLELDQPVALKFLTAVRFDERARGRLRNEVRLARQVSHPNVCRVYDIGDAQGESYLSMEYVDGEDLGASLRRIGKLPVDKALEIAFKLCDGLAAAHAKGVLHRDLKPANIMIDSSGEVRIMDFGLAAITDDLRATQSQEGTPLYMAPEQLAGQKVSVQSDIYAVGLVFYEMLTGKPPFAGDTPAELRRLRQESRIAPPSSFVADLEPAVERAILRCLDPDPRMRPPSAVAVSALLPGGDPLARALAAGETPLPEEIAAAGPTEPLKPVKAMLLLAAIAVGIAVFCVAAPKGNLLNWLSLENPPEVLAAKAQEIARDLGYTDRPKDRAWGFGNETGEEYFKFMEGKVDGEEQWRKALSMPPPLLSFWYRQSPEPFRPVEIPYWNTDSVQRVRPEDPLTTAGMLSVGSDTEGRLLRFEAQFQPDRSSQPTDDQTSTPDWSRLFATAGLDFARFRPAPSQFARPIPTDARVAWSGTYAERPDVPLRVEAASLHGRVVYFEVVRPWNQAVVPPPPVFDLIFLVILVTSALLARRNWSTGRADRSGALRLGLLGSMFVVTNWALESDFADWGHVVVGMLSTAIPDALFAGGFNALLYLAIEPWGRRDLAGTMISWSRVLAGRWRDPLVGWDILLGLLSGVGWILLSCLDGFNTLRLNGHPAPILRFPGSPPGPAALADPFSAMTGIVEVAWWAIADGLMFFGLLVTLTLLLRNKWLAAAGVVAFVILQVGLQVGLHWMSFAVALLIVTIMLRFGLFAFVIWDFTALIFGTFFTTDFSMWYGKSSLVALIAIGALALLGFRLSILGRPLWRDIRNPAEAGR